MDYKNKYLKYKKKYLKHKLFGLSGGNNKIKVTKEIIINKAFIKWIKEKSQFYFNEFKERLPIREFGGFITFNSETDFSLTDDNPNDSKGDTLFAVDKADNIPDNQILWHTRFRKRGYKCEAPGGADINILLNIARNTNKLPISINVEENGFWMYYLTRELSDKMKEEVPWHLSEKFSHFPLFVQCTSKI